MCASKTIDKEHAMNRFPNRLLIVNSPMRIVATQFDQQNPAQATDGNSIV
jgi:hypothetical protein